MKILFAFLSSLFFLTANAQNAFLRRDLLINGGLGLIHYTNPEFPASEQVFKSLPVFLSVEYAIKPKISVGVFVGYYSRAYRYLDSIPNEVTAERVFKSRYVPVGIKASVHFAEWLEKRYKVDIGSDNLDLYVSGLLGYKINFLSHIGGINNLQTDSKVTAGIVLGARYYFHHRFAAFAEVGPGIFGWGGLGITVRF